MFHRLLAALFVFKVYGLSWAKSDRVVCYYANWSAYRPGIAKFLPQNINPYLCTHLIYAFGGFSADFTLKPFDKWQDIDQGGYAKFNGLKVYNRNLKTLLAIGGWNEGSARFSKFVANATMRQNLAKSSLKFLRQHNFDGLDLDWEYPSSRDGSRAADKANYALLVHDSYFQICEEISLTMKGNDIFFPLMKLLNCQPKELREAFNKESTGKRSKLLLTMAVPAGEGLMSQGYDIKSLNRDLDFMNVMTYDYHTAGESQLGHHAPLKGIDDPSAYDPNEELNLVKSVEIYLKNGLSADKLVIGIPTYGRAFKLISRDETDIGSPAQGPAAAGKSTRERGYLAYYEICEKIGIEGWSVRKPDPDRYGPFAYSDDEWVGYDDEEMAATKAEFALEKGLGGVMFWSIDNDDFRGLCTGQPYPLIEAAKSVLSADTNEPPTQISQTIKSKPYGTRTTTTHYQPTTTPVPPPTPPAVSAFVCEVEGFFPNPEDCTKYFWCLDTSSAGLVSHTFTCPSGLIFNKLTDSCDYATNVACKEAPASIYSATFEPFLGESTTLAPRNRKIMRKPTPTTTTTTDPATDSYESNEKEESSDELKKLLLLIKNLGGTEALQQFIEKNNKSDPKVSINGNESPSSDRIVQQNSDRTSTRKLIHTTEAPTSSMKSFAASSHTSTKASSERKAVSVKIQPYKVTIKDLLTANPALKPLDLTSSSASSTIKPTTSNKLLSPQQTTPFKAPSSTLPPPSSTSRSITTINISNTKQTTTLGSTLSPPSSMSNPTTSITITNTQPTMDLEEDATTGMTPTKPEDSSIPPVPESIVTVMPSYIESPSDPEEGFYVTLAQTITTDSIEPHLEIETQPMADDSIESHLDNGITEFSANTMTSSSRPINSEDELIDLSDEEDILQTTSTATTTATATATSAAETTTTMATATKRTTPTTTAHGLSPWIARKEIVVTSRRRLPTSTTEMTAVRRHRLIRSTTPASVDEEPTGPVIVIRNRVICNDVGTFHHPSDCKKFVQCARDPVVGIIRGRVRSCPHTWSFDLIEGVCNRQTILVNGCLR